MSSLSYKGSIKKRLVWIILLATSLSGLLGYSAFLYWYVDDQYNKNIELSKTIADVLGQNLAKIILLNDVSVASEVTTALKSFPHIDSMVLYDKKGKAIFEYSKSGKSFVADALPDKLHRKSFEKGDRLRLYLDAIYQGRKLGYIQLNLKVKSVFDITKDNIPILIPIYLIMIIFSYLLAVLFAGKFTKPVLELVPFLEKINLTDSIRARMVIRENNEYGRLYKEINTMLDRIEENYDAQKIAAVAFEAQSGMFVADRRLKILRVNRAFTKIMGYKPEDVIGKSSTIFRSDVHSQEFHKEVRRSLTKHGYWSGEIYSLLKNGTIRPQSVTIQAVKDDNSEVLYYVFSFIDLGVQKDIEAKLDFVKRYDILTGLQNRDSILKDMQENLDSLRDDKWGALLRFDIKDFKILNDAYGRSIGDLLLIQIAKKLKENFPDAKMMGRLVADDFMICFSSLSNQKYSASIQSKMIAKKLIELLEEEFELGGKLVHIVVYVGIALYDRDINLASDLLKHADIALRIAKEEERQIAFFDKQAENIAKSHIDIYTQLLTALKEDQFELVYQLQYNKNKEVYAAESLLRWNHPTRGFLSPSEFIFVAEKTGLILPIGQWVIKAACKQLAQWKKNKKTANWVLAINVSAKQFKDENFVKNLKYEVLKNEIDYKNIKLELTESVLIDDMEKIIQKMQELKDLGIQISLDDFGTGYSSLEYLKKLPIDQMKIDLSFVMNMLYDKRDVAIIKSILLLGKALKLEVIAEGVETKEHLDNLKELGCDFYQGFYFARPERIETINKLVGV